VLPSCQVLLIASEGSGCAKHVGGGQGVRGVTACHPPTKVQTVLFVSSMVMFVEAVNAGAARSACKTSVAPVPLKRGTMVVET
jgi:hypothetical protein